MRKDEGANPTAVGVTEDSRLIRVSAVDSGPSAPGAFKVLHPSPPDNTRPVGREKLRKKKRATSRHPTMDFHLDHGGIWVEYN